MNSAAAFIFGLAFIMLNLMEQTSCATGLVGNEDNINFCDPQMCPKNKRHIRCVRQLVWGPSCTSDRQVQDMSDSLITTILNKHNSYRNDIAGGQMYRTLAPAGQMSVVQWDWQLANNALFNVMQCEMTHDECRSTPRFRNAGQNIAWMAWKGGNPSVEFVAGKQIDSFFSEWQNATMREIDSYQKTLSGAVIGHFTQMVKDNSISVGCHIVRQTSNGWTEQYMTCNYAFGNMLTDAIYKSSPVPASMCKSGTDSTYRNLCSTAENYGF